jgi:hypothetical protein
MSNPRKQARNKMKRPRKMSTAKLKPLLTTTLSNLTLGTMIAFSQKKSRHLNVLRERKRRGHWKRLQYWVELLKVR